MRTGMMALALGLLALRFLPVLPPVGLWMSLPPVGLMLLPFRTYPLAFFLFGFSWACANVQWALDDRLPLDLDGETRWIEGRVTGLPQNADGVVRFELTDSQSRRTKLPARLRLAWYDGPSVNSGERWRLAVKLKRPSGLLNPHAFDYDAWLLAQHIGATGTVKDGERLAEARWAWRDGIRQRLLAVDAQGRTAALTALVLGDGAGLSREEWQVLQDTGTVHLLVISGQHIGLLAGLVYLLIAGLARFGLWPGRLPWLPWACGLAFSAALAYGLLAGFDVPVQRACVMVGLVLLWRLRFRHLGAWWPLLLALNGVLLLDPLASLQPGFWLSFAAVAVLIFTFGGRLGPLAMVANLDPGSMADRNRSVPVAAGARPANQHQRAGGQFAGSALDQSGGVATRLARDSVVACALCGRRVAVAGRRFDRRAVQGAGINGRAIARMGTGGRTVVVLGTRYFGGLSTLAAARRTAAPVRVAVDAVAGSSASAVVA